MTLKELIEAYRPDFNSSIFEQVNLGKNHCKESIKGALAETYVSIWLSQLKEFNRFYAPEDLVRINGYEFEQSSQGILILNHGEAMCELDQVAQIEEITVGVEVKALKLNGIEGQLERKIAITKQITGDDQAQFLLFFPQYTNKIKDAKRIKEKYPEVSCIDMGYKKKQLMRLVDSYCQYIYK